jgi:hypothetical protein
MYGENGIVLACTIGLGGACTANFGIGAVPGLHSIFRPFLYSHFARNARKHQFA